MAESRGLCPYSLRDLVPIRIKLFGSWGREGEPQLCQLICRWMVSRSPWSLGKLWKVDDAGRRACWRCCHGHCGWAIQVSDKMRFSSRFESLNGVRNIEGFEPVGTPPGSNPAQKEPHSLAANIEHIRAGWTIQDANDQGKSREQHAWHLPLWPQHSCSCWEQWRSDLSERDYCKRRGDRPESRWDTLIG